MTPGRRRAPRRPVLRARGGRRRRDARRRADVAEASLARAAKARDLYGAFLSIDADAALRQADDVDRRVAAGERLPLAGVPLAVKDNINVAGRPSTAGSRILAGFVAPDDATCVARLVAAGAVVVGKTNCDEFGMGSSNENSAYGAGSKSLGSRRACRAAPPAAPRPRSRRARCRSRSGRTRAAPCASPPRSAASWDGSRRTGASRATGSSRSPRRSTRRERSRADVRDARARVHGDGGRRPEGRDVARDAGAGRRGGARRGRARAGASASSPRPRRPKAASTPRSRRRLRAHGGRAARRRRRRHDACLGAARAVRRAGLLPDGDGRGLLEPRPLRRRAVRRARGREVARRDCTADRAPRASGRR